LFQKSCKSALLAEHHNNFDDYAKHVTDCSLELFLPLSLASDSLKNLAERILDDGQLSQESIPLLKEFLIEYNKRLVQTIIHDGISSLCGTTLDMMATEHNTKLINEST